MKIGMRGGSRLAAVAMMAGMVMLTGCRDEEQDRVLLFEQGNYQGKPDDTLSDDQVSELRSRAMRQQY